MDYPEHFSRDELLFSQFAERRDIDNTPQSPEIEKNLIKLANWLEELRKTINAPIIITSGYRCPELNAREGGSPTSAHMQGLAADIHVPGMSILELAEHIVEVMDNYDQVIYEFRRWVHVGLARGVPRLQKLTAVRENGETVYPVGFV